MQKQLKVGHKAEHETVAVLESLGYQCEFNTNPETRKYWDILAVKDGIEFRLEVKNDVMSNVTKNVAIEYQNAKSGENSGIKATKANFWVHKIQGQLYITPIHKLKEFVASVTPKKTITAGGDNNANFYIYGVNDILPVFTKLGDVTKLCEI